MGKFIRRHIELFAGCGGLSLGLEAAGWSLRLANEVSDMAAETFAYNLLGAEWDESDSIKQKVVGKVSQVNSLSLKDWKEKKLLVGDVVELVKSLEKRPGLVKELKDIDLVSGGPPCQGFSLAGKRKERDPKNKLPYAFVDFVKLVQPKLVLLENVEGILRPFKSDGGVKVPWIELSKAFASIGYAPMAFLLNAKYFSIPQNRPRFVLIGIRKDLKYHLLEKLEHKRNSKAYTRYATSFILADEDESIITNYNGHLNNIFLECVDIHDYNTFEDRLADFTYDNLFPEVTSNTFTVSEAIDDLIENGRVVSKGDKPYTFALNGKTSDYARFLSAQFQSSIHHPKSHNSGIHNHELRKHGEIASFRFSIIQRINDIEPEFRKPIEDFIRGRTDDTKAFNELWKIMKSDKLFKERYKLKSEAKFHLLVDQIRSKKNVQRALLKDRPAPAQVTIPDDLCHYSKVQPRVLTVREMARIQSFPDEFVFKSKVTTGGKLRKQEVPQYTQVGNAVPPLLGYNLGKLLMKILE